MFAVIAAILFGLALLFDLADSTAVNTGTLTLAGFFCIALHLVGVGAGWRWGSWGARRNWRRR